MEIRVDMMNPIPARVRVVINGQTATMTLDETAQLIKALETSVGLAKKAK